MLKKLSALLLVVSMLFSLSACFGNKPTKEIYVSSQSDSVKETPKEEIFSLNETAVFDDLKITATEIKETSGDDFFEPKDGNVFVGFKIIIENISSEEQTISSMLLFEAYADDIKCDYSLNATCAFEGGLDGNLASGKKMVGWYAVEVPRDWENIELDVKASWLSNNSAKFVFEK